MNYIELINLFWQTRRRVRLSSGNKYPDIRDVVRYVQWQNATGSLFDDDTATSCMSYYGLCE